MRILDWNEYTECARETAAEGAVLLENDGTLPLSREKQIALFGRMQLHYYKSGTGSGGLVNAPVVKGILDGLVDAGAKLDEQVLETYRKWDRENPVEIASKGWGSEPWSQKEMPLDEELVARAAKASDTAVCIIARTAGEEQENKAEKGSYYLTDGEEAMLAVVSRHFAHVCVLINAGNIIDMSFVKKYGIGAVMYVWHGGMTGGSAVADVLYDVSPSGHLPDTIPVCLSDVPSDDNFGDIERDYYKEDIFVGYRYYETLGKDVLYPFGYGLSYTSFDVKAAVVSGSASGAQVSVTVTNTGSRKGKRAVMVYISAPCGRLTKPARVLAGFDKTDALAPGESVTIGISLPPRSFASYDEEKSAFVLEKGTYSVYVGTDVRSAEKCGEFAVDKDFTVKQLSQALAPVEKFERLRADGSYELVPMQKVSEEDRRSQALPAEIPMTGDRGIKLADVGRTASLEEFIAQLSAEDLCCMAKGEGMSSPRVTLGTAAAFGGVSDGLTAFGIPAACCADGPSGIRMDCGTQAFSLPIGTLIASTFNKKLARRLFAFVGTELCANDIDALLGPGMNIHRHPLGGRNFEYFSEDPLLTGEMAAAELSGLRDGGSFGVIKHFCCNNQEVSRHHLDSVVSERALREIYLRGFEIAVENGCKLIMTTYGKLNGIHTCGHYDLNTAILRDQWGFDGMVMTDWWANTDRRGGKETGDYDIASVARSQNDVYMVVGDSLSHKDNLSAALEEGYITIGELQRNAMNICRYILSTRAMDRMRGTAEEIRIINRPEAKDEAEGDVPEYTVNGSLVLDEPVTAEGGKAKYMVLDIPDYGGFYTVKITAKGSGSELSQLPLTVYSMGTPCHTFTYRGGAEETFSGDIVFFSRFTTIKLFFAQAGLTVTRIEIVKKAG